ncbi:hypothetical protein [uncultured Ellagibacter sp.]|uniref:hypothetical protein n=1 Tax=uncultured Ellagibacter sp. TaxID=2137580 RepID=UPI00260376E0|nr:hypothetical protein [uncultured Ellagibacter sp.]
MDVLAFGLPWENIVVDLVGYLPVQILYGYVMTRLLDIPRPALFVVAYSICSFLVVPFSSLIGMPLFGLMEALLCATPALLARDRALHCVIIVASSIVAVAIAYLAFLLLWMLVADDSFSYQEKYARLAGYAVASGLHLIVLDALFVLLRRTQSRWLTPEVKRYTGEGTKYFIWFPLLQVPFLLIALIGIGTAAAWNPLLVVGVLLMGVFFLVSDLVLFRAIDDFVLEQFEALRIEVLERQLDEELKLFDDLSALLENSAQLRHDLHNHLQIIEMLASRGEFDVAREHVRNLLGEIESMDARDGSVILRSKAALSAASPLCEPAALSSDRA